jgi:predicted phosphoribosyltransferase
VIVGHEIARRLGCELDVIVARKVGAPHQHELAIGAVTADGTRVLNSALIRDLRVDAGYMERTFSAEADEARAREARLRVGPGADPIGRSVVLVDDGLATGATLRACVAALEHRHARSVIVAVPVGSTDACRALSKLVDQMICPLEPQPLLAVGHHYRSFPQVSDGEVRKVLQGHRAWLAANQIAYRRRSA